MKRQNAGFGLVEIMVALVLGLIVVMGILQIFSSARATWLSQSSAARLQEDARFILSKLTQEVRMTGMYGCLAFDSTVASNAIAKPAIFDTPIQWDATSRTLTLVTADVGTAGNSPTWTVVSDCQSTSQVYVGTAPSSVKGTRFPLRKLVYQVSNNQLTMQDGLAANPPRQPVLDGVSNFDVAFGLAGSTMSYSAANVTTAVASANVLSLRLALSLKDPDNRVAVQNYSVVAALRNRF